MSRRPRKGLTPAPVRAPEERPGLPGGVRDTRRRELTARLAREALALFLAQGVEAVSIDEIAAAAGISKGSFYTYFDDKPTLVRAVIETVAAPVRAALARCAGAIDAAKSPAALRAAYSVLATELAVALLAQPEVVALYLQESRGPAVGARAPISAFAEEIHERAVALTRAAHRLGLLKPLDPEVTAAAVVGAAEALIHRAFTGRDLGEPARVTEALVTMVVEGLGVRRAPRRPRAGAS